jgi:hypothetical protein
MIEIDDQNANEVHSSDAEACAANLLADTEIPPPREVSKQPEGTPQQFKAAQTDKLKELLGPLLGGPWNDHRHAYEVEKSDNAALAKPISKEEFQKAREILKRADNQPDSETRKDIAKFIGLPESAKDADIRKKLAMQYPQPDRTIKPPEEPILPILRLEKK